MPQTQNSFFSVLFGCFLSEVSGTNDNIKKYREYNDDTDDKSLDADLCTDHVQTIFQCLPNGCTCEGSKKDSSSSKWGNATDYAGCYAVHLVHVSCFHVAHSCLCAEDITNDTRADSTYQICLNCCIYNIHTGQFRSIHVGADRVNMSSCARRKKKIRKITRAIQKVL